MCRIGTGAVKIPQDNTRVASKPCPQVENKSQEPKKEIHSKGNQDSKHSVNVDSKLHKTGHGTKNIKLVDDHGEGHERGVLYKAKEEAVVKTSEKTACKTSEKVLEKVAQRTAIKAGEQIAADAAVTVGVEAAEQAAKKAGTKSVGKALGKVGQHTDNIVKKGAEKLAESSVKAMAKIETNAVGKTVVKALGHVGHGAEHAVSKGIEKVAGKSLEKTAAVVASKIGVKAASRLGAMVPVAGVAVGAYITKHDYDDFKAKMKDPTVTKTSKVLAGATVALDGLSTGASAVAAACAGTGIGLPVAAVAEGVSWISTGASIVTSAGSEYWKH